MKNLAGLMLLAILASGCQKSEVVSPFTGNEATYDLQQASTFSVSGTVTFKERKDGRISAVIKLTGTEGDLKHPVHLHMGDIAKTGADITLLMSPVLGKTGQSETIFNTLSDESSINYQQLINLPACIKIHLGDTGPERDVILAAGNIGTSVAKPLVGGKLGVGVCKSE